MSKVFFGGVVQKFKRHNFLGKKGVFLVLSSFRTKTFRPFGITLSAVFTKLYFTYLHEHFEGKTFYFDNIFFVVLPFADIEQTNIGRLLKIFKQGCRKCILSVARNLLSEILCFFQNNCNTKKFMTLSERKWPSENFGRTDRTPDYVSIAFF